MSYCTHGCGNPHQCLTCVSERQTQQLTDVIREAASCLRKDAVPVQATTPSPASDPCDRKPLTKPELLFLNGHDAIFGVNGELFTAVCGRWIRTQ